MFADVGKGSSPALIKYSIRQDIQKKTIAAARCSRIATRHNETPLATAYSLVAILSLVFLGAHTRQKLDSRVFECREPLNLKGVIWQRKRLEYDALWKALCAGGRTLGECSRAEKAKGVDQTETAMGEREAEELKKRQRTVERAGLGSVYIS